MIMYVILSYTISREVEEENISQSYSWHDLYLVQISSRYVYQNNKLSRTARITYEEHHIAR